MDLKEEKAKFVFKMKLDIRWSDMDEMGHVNNAVYLTYFENARIGYFEESCDWNWQEQHAILASAHVDYVKPVIFPHPTYAYVRTTKLGNKSLELGYLITTLTNGVEELATRGITIMVMYDYLNNLSIAIPDFIRDKIRAYETETF